MFFGHVCFAVNAKKEGRKEGRHWHLLLLTSIVQSELERISLSHSHSLSLSLTVFARVCVFIWRVKKRGKGERKITNRGDRDFEGLRELWRSSKNRTACGTIATLIKTFFSWTQDLSLLSSEAAKKQNNKNFFFVKFWNWKNERRRRRLTVENFFGCTSGRNRF